LSKLGYDKAKEALGIDWRYDFVIRIFSNDGRLILEYPQNADLKNADIVARYSRNVVIAKSINASPLKISSGVDTNPEEIIENMYMERMLANFEMIVYR